MSTHADETRTTAAHVEHPWDERALDWPELTQDSVVVEVGGYKGRWALQIAERYAPHLYVFEPQAWAANVCREVLGDRAMVLALALGARTDAMLVGEWETDGCSLVKEGTFQIAVAEIGGIFRQLGLAHIDLMLMNIEGYEYTLIPHMLDKGILPDRLMVQFHTFADPSGTRQVAIYQRLADCGYRTAWTYGVVLTAWERDR